MEIAGFGIKHAGFLKEREREREREHLSTKINVWLLLQKLFRIITCIQNLCTWVAPVVFPNLKQSKIFIGFFPAPKKQVMSFTNIFSHRLPISLQTLKPM
jgi:hypothetical protein